jgi:carboxymethylenebutenolidase
MKEAGHKMSNLDWPKALSDLSTVKNHFVKDSESVSVVGFCMGGALTFAALSSIQGWKTGGVFYGIPDLNIFRLDKITAKVIAHFGELDPLKGFSDVVSANKLKADCERASYPVDVQYLLPY